jgi:benzylsuccinate CoA-transferase BbsF subunit
MSESDAHRSPEGAPLAGVRVTDFTWAWAGPHGTLYLAMLGAEVIKIESHARPDHTRLRSLQSGALTTGPDGSTYFNDLNLGKLSLTLNLRKEEARDLVRRLVAKSDVVVQNMRPGVLDRLGIGYRDLRQIKPDIVMLSSSAVGATGPEKSYVGYAPTFASLSGIADLSGYPDQQPIPLSGSVDLRVGTTGTFAVLAALYHRERTGQGQHIDLSSTEAISAMMGDAFVGYSVTGRIPERCGNRDSVMAPHGCYRCAGEEPRWVSIAVGSQAEWAALKSVLADPELEDEAFATPEGRWRDQEKIDAILERWTREREPAEATRILQRAGVAALPVESSLTLSSDPHVLERGVLTRVTHPVLGERIVVGAPWNMEGVGVRGPAPLIGQHNDYVLGEILGMSREEIDRLTQEGVVY